MAIVIPSNKIYGFPEPLSYPKNKILNVESKVNEVKQSIGNILNEDLKIHFYSVSENENGLNSFTYIGNENPSDIVTINLDRINTDSDITTFERIEAYGEIRVVIPNITKLSLGLEQYKIKIKLNYSTELPSLDIESLDKEYIFDLSKNRADTEIGLVFSNAKYYEEDNNNILKFNFRFRIKDLVTYLLESNISIEGIYYQYDEAKYKLESNINSNSFEIPSNELLQSSSTYSGSNYWEYLSGSVVDRYNKGKETITIRCSISSYYDTNGVLVINPYSKDNIPCFGLHDRVIPYIYTMTGDVPLSNNSNGTPKQYEIVGIEFINKGVPWQELTLQENPN